MSAIVSSSTLADRWKMPARTVSEILRPIHREEGGYDADEAADMMVAHFRNAATKADSDGASHRARKAKAEADIAEMQAVKMAEECDWVVSVIEGWRAEVVSGVAKLRFSAAVESELLAMMRDAEQKVRHEIALAVRE